MNSTIMHTNTYGMRVPEGEERQKKEERLLEEIMAKNFPQLRKNMQLQTQEAQ